MTDGTPTTTPRHRASVLAAFVLALLLPAVVCAAPWGYLVSADGKTRIPLEKPEVLIGSAATAGAVVKHRTVSKKHLLIRHTKGIVTVKGLRSKFGTLVAGTLLRPGRTMQLYKRTQLTLGAVTWAFEWGARGKIIPPQRKAKPTPKAARSKTRKAQASAKRKATKPTPRPAKTK